MKIYTKTGDEGQTGLFAGPRVEKHHPRIEAYGTVDELNAALGATRAAQPPADIDSLLCQVQNELFALGAELATPDAERHGMALLGDPQIAALEQAIDHFEAGLEPLRQFILPAGSPAATALHVARTVCRRAEREVSRLATMPDEKVSSHPLIYLNRLSDLLFVLARAANLAAGHAETPWTKPDSPSPP
jgi:cob(I)alamin adenosyltransferase